MRYYTINHFYDWRISGEGLRYFWPSKETKIHFTITQSRDREGALNVLSKTFGFNFALLLIYFHQRSLTLAALSLLRIGSFS